MRISGPVVNENSYTKLGAYHTLEISITYFGSTKYKITNPFFTAILIFVLFHHSDQNNVYYIFIETYFFLAINKNFTLEKEHWDSIYFSRFIYFISFTYTPFILFQHANFSFFIFFSIIIISQRHNISSQHIIITTPPHIIITPSRHIIIITTSQHITTSFRLNHNRLSDSTRRVTSQRVRMSALCFSENILLIFALSLLHVRQSSRNCLLHSQIRNLAKSAKRSPRNSLRMYIVI